MTDLLEEVADLVRTYEAGMENPWEIAGKILAIPEIRDALQEMESLDDRLADAREDGWRACEESRD